MHFTVVINHLGLFDPQNVELTSRIELASMAHTSVRLCIHSYSDSQRLSFMTCPCNALPSDSAKSRPSPLQNRKRSIARAIPVPANHKDSLLRPPYHFTLDKVGIVGIKFGLLGLMHPPLQIEISELDLLSVFHES